MRRARRSQIIRETLIYCAELIGAMEANGDGYYVIGETDEEHELVRETALRLADSIRARAGRMS